MTNLVLLDAILRPEKYSVRTACSQGIAMRIMKRWQPDLIVLDLLMPGQEEGFEFFNMIKDDFRHYKIKVAIISALTDKQIIEHTLSEGAVDYIFKPVNIKLFIDRINKILG